MVAKNTLPTQPVLEGVTAYTAVAKALEILAMVSETVDCGVI